MSDPMSDPMESPDMPQTAGHAAHISGVSLAPGLPDEVLGHVPHHLLQDWLTLFVNRELPYAVQQADGSYRWVYEPVTPALLAAHLAGQITLALSSSDARGRCRWACLDVDVPGSLPQLLAVREPLAELELPGLVEASRRGGHLWLFFDEPLPTVAARHVVAAALTAVAAQSVEVPALELYPDGCAPSALGHAVRLPLGVHHKTGLRYPLFDTAGLPCVFTSLEKAAAFLLDAPRISAAPLRAQWEASATQQAARVKAQRHHEHHDAGAHDTGAHHAGQQDGQKQDAHQDDALATPTQRWGRGVAVGSRVGSRVGTRSEVIRWVDAHVSSLEVLAELDPDAEMRRAGRGYLGWCPFHDDRARDAAGLPGSPSFYVVQDRRFGWSWRCLSTTCAQSVGPMRHSFRLWQELLAVSVSSAIVEALRRWPAAAARGAGADMGGDIGGALSAEIDPYTGNEAKGPEPHEPMEGERADDHR